MRRNVETLRSEENVRTCILGRETDAHVTRNEAKRALINIKRLRNTEISSDRMLMCSEVWKHLEHKRHPALDPGLMSATTTR